MPASPESSYNHQVEPPSQPPKNHQQQHARAQRVSARTKPSQNAAADGLTPEQSLALECLLVAAPQFHNPRAFVRTYRPKLIAHWAQYVNDPKLEFDIRNPAAFIRASVEKGEAAPMAARFDTWWYDKLTTNANSNLNTTQETMDY